MNTTFFDLSTGLDTARSMSSKLAGVNPHHVTDAVDYLPSWTRTIRKAFRVVRRELGTQALESTFVDVGSGKGKVCIVWAHELRRARIKSADMLAVEISEVLCRVAKENIERAGLGQQVQIITEDAGQISLADKEKVLLWLYNPFGSDTLSKLLKAMDGRVVGIVYGNPLAHETVVQNGYELIHRDLGWHSNLNFNIYAPIGGSRPNCLNGDGSEITV